MLALGLVAALFAAPDGNLLLNPDFSFHSFDNSRSGNATAWRSGSVPCWQSDGYDQVQVQRGPRVSGWRTAFPVDGVAQIRPGRRLAQLVLLAEAGLDHGDRVSLSVHGFQRAPDCLAVRLHLVRLDSASGDWSPAEFGVDDPRRFPKHSRGDLIWGLSSEQLSGASGHFTTRVENVEVAGAFTEAANSSTDQPNTIGLAVELVNRSTDQDVWVYAPCLAAGATARDRLPAARALPTAYRGLPNTIRKLWRGEPLHLIVMGSSIDRASANPPLYYYDENPASATFKQPLTGRDFDGARVGHPEWNPYIARWQHYYGYSGWLRRALLAKYGYPIQKLLLNVMACDGSSIGESHSGLASYAGLALPPNPEFNGHAAGQTWQELYPDLFARPGGPRPDLVIFGSGANEKVDTPDEVAAFEGAIRWFQRHYPGLEFVFCMWQNRESYTANTGALAELALRYQIPLLDLGQLLNLTTRYCNSYALVPSDGHPQAAAHELWGRLLERAFDVTDPVAAGTAQVLLPERLNPYTVGWEGEATTYPAASPRIHEGTALILDDCTVNLWAASTEPAVEVRLDGQTGPGGSRRRPSPQRDERNSTYAYGRLSLGDRHLVEVLPPAKLAAVDCKSVLNRQFCSVASARWEKGLLTPTPHASAWGAPYGDQQVLLPVGGTLRLETVGTDLAVAWVDRPDGGTLQVSVDAAPPVAIATNQPFAAVGGPLFLENRRGLRGLPYGWHALTLTASEAPVAVLGAFSYDTRPNRAAERVQRGFAAPGELVRFEPPFASRPMLRTSGGLQARLADVSASGATFAGTAAGSWEAVGE
ncbi:MAG: hypothetical protein IT204_10345 [Fimbriimonadaceae bacterium]|nr:hypothetical protein [Fimbriimonadaceae bacterium]